MKRSGFYRKKRRAPRAWLAIIPAVAVCAGVLVYFLGGHASVQAGIARPSSSAASSRGGASQAKVDTVSSAPVLTGRALSKASLPAVQVSLTDAAQPLWVDVRLSTQNVVVYDAQNRVVQSYICSSGAPGYETPKGTYTVPDSTAALKTRGLNFYTEKYKEGGHYYVRFYQGYLFHSVPVDENNKIIPEQEAALGTPSSHGCIHLALDNAKWMYDNIPVGTKVVVE